jgi:hypothetical protein
MRCIVQENISLGNNFFAVGGVRVVDARMDLTDSSTERVERNRIRRPILAIVSAFSVTDVNSTVERRLTRRCRDSVRWTAAPGLFSL